jgi:hypothetical protein
MAHRLAAIAALLSHRIAEAGAAFDKELSEMATSVCANDSRTIAQRRADALIALTEGRTLACNCCQPECPARTAETEPAAGGVHTVINVIATDATVTGDSDQPGYLEGYGVIDAEHVRELADTATIRPVEYPTLTAEEALRYQPSAALERWIRCRDLTCRFPGCDRKAWICDIDHTTPFNHADPAAGGLTVPWDLACYCREHHRLKTFHAGPRGGATNSCPTAPSCGHRRPAGPIAPPRAGLTCFRSYVRPVGHPHRPSAAGRRKSQSGLPTPARRFEISDPSTPKHVASIEPVRKRSLTASGVTTCARSSSCSRAASRVPVPGAHGSTTPSNPKSFHPTGNHRRHHRNNSTTSHRSSRTAVVPACAPTTIRQRSAGQCRTLSRIAIAASVLSGIAVKSFP